MKHGQALIIGLLICGLLLHICNADISLTLRNVNNDSGHHGGQSYLPPAVQGLHIDEAINRAITEEIVNIENGKQGKFRESSYGNNRYHIFEVHNRFSPGSGGMTGFKGPDYLPPVQSNAIESNRQTLPAAPTTNIPIPFPSNYQHDFQKKSQSGVQAELSDYQVPEYLSPQGSEQLADAEGAGGFQGPDYLPPNEEQHGQQQQNHHEDAGGYSGSISSFRGSDYLPPLSGKQEPTFSKSKTNYEGNLPSIRESLLNSREQAGGFSGPDYLPPHAHLQEELLSQSTPTQQSFQGPDYLPPHPYPEESFSQPPSTQQNPQVLNNLSPNTHHEENLSQPIPTQQIYQGPDYLPPQPHENENILSQPIPTQQNYQGPDYLPPQAHKNEDILSQPIPTQQNYQGPDYLPPQAHKNEDILSQPVPTTRSFQGSNYLSPHTRSHEESSQQSITPTQQSYKGPDYLPPHSYHEESLSQSILKQQRYKGPDYLPPHVHSHQEPLTQTITSHQNYRAPDYLPPHNENTQHSHSPATPTLAISSYNSGVYSSGTEEAQPPVQTHAHSHSLNVPRPTQVAQDLPTGYDFVRPSNADEAFAQLHSLQLQQQQRQHQVSTVGSQDHVVQTEIQVGGRGVTSDIIYGKPKLEARSNGGNAYLAPTQASVGPTLPTHRSQNSLDSFSQSQAPLHLPQQSFNSIAQTTMASTAYRAPPYLPPETYSIPPVASSSLDSQHLHLHSLSSYMNSVQPYARYGAAQYAEPRRPFAKYGPPPAIGASAQLPQSHSASHVEVAPMYREQASRPQHYAPAMSYANNAIAQRYTTYMAPPKSATQPQHQQAFSLSPQSKQALQSFMPKEVQKQVAVTSAVSDAIVFPSSAPTAAVHTAITPVTSVSGGKIRTVQIINPHTVRTLKVLETSDHAGIKTIKILGTSNENPMGEHHIVKVVSQSGLDGSENHVQTVKIFNDHKDVSLPAVAATVAGFTAVTQQVGSNAYLPAHSSFARKRSIRIARESVLRRHHGFYQRAKVAAHHQKY